MVVGVSVVIGRGDNEENSFSWVSTERRFYLRGTLCVATLCCHLYHPTPAWQSTDVFVQSWELLVPLAPNLYHGWALLHRNPSCTSCPVQLSQHFSCKKNSSGRDLSPNQQQKLTTQEKGLHKAGVSEWEGEGSTTGVCPNSVLGNTEKPSTDIHLHTSENQARRKRLMTHSAPLFSHQSNN